jgi:hypothetical protein
MAFNFPQFDFNDYNPKDPWHVPPQRIVHFAFSAMEIASTSRRFWALRYKYPDLRFTIFHCLSGYAYALGGWAMLLRDKGHSVEWWQAQPEFNHTFSSTLVNSNVMGMRQLMELGYFQNVVREIDLDFRQIGAALWPDAQTQHKAMPLNRLWRQILEACDVQRFQSMLPLFQILRDSVSNNGKFCPTDFEDLTLNYGSRSFHFAANKEIDYAGMGFIDQWDMALFLLGELDSLLNQLFKSPKLTAISLIKMRHMEE